MVVMALKATEVRALAGVTSRIAGESAETAMPVFSSIDDDSGEHGAYTRNTDCWLSDIDLTAFPVYTETHNGGIAITPRHVFFCGHHMPTSGEIRFVTNGDVVAWATVSDSAKQTNPLGALTPYDDFGVALLNEDLPATITPVSVMPSNWGSFLANYYAADNMLCVWFNQDSKAVVGRIGYFSNDRMQTVVKPSNEPQVNFWLNGVNGDSSAPTCLVLDGELVLTGALSNGGTNCSGPAFGPNYDAIATLVSDLGGGHELSPFTLR